MFRVRTRDLTPTFGSPLGAQLVDVYVHDAGRDADLDGRVVPAAQLRDRGGGAWSRLIEVQGFGQRYVDASGATLGDVGIRARRELALHHVQRDRRPASATPGPGWGFTVMLTGQDGFSPDQARGFAPTPQAFEFGVCAAASSDPHCTFAPGHGAQGDGRPGAGRDEPGRRARLHASTPR